jgi:Ca-activated chloride channel family protein
MVAAPEPAKKGESGRRLKGQMVGYVAQEQAVTNRQAPPSTGGTTEPNDAPYGDVFFAEYGINPFIDTDDDALSTFGLDVDTGSYTVIRRYLRDGHLPPREAVRVEEVVNAFDYGDPPPRRGDFRLTAEAAPTPFGEGDRYAVVRFGIRARDVDASHRPPAHLTFVVDVSGSMARENRLGLVKKALAELLDHLRSDDRVALVVFGSSGQVLLEPTEDHERIRAAIDRLAPSGSTNAEEGLVLGYELAARQLDEPGIHRLILCSDGVANVGRTGPESILGRIRKYADQGVELTTVGFGMGNYNDVLMEQLADTGDGRYAYVDTLSEARRLFVEELTGTLMTVARDAKAQVELEPRVVSRYRLLGYENRDIADERFRDPTVDAGEIGAGHSVTAVYEIKLRADAPRRGTLATLRLRYRPADGGEPVELEQRLDVRDLAPSWGDAPASLRLASLVAEYAELLKGSYWAREGDMYDVLRRAQLLAPSFSGDTRVADWVSLVATAAELRGEDRSHGDEDR